MPSLDVVQLKPCPEDFITYKKQCFFKGKHTLIYDDAEEKCAYRGSQILSIKERGSFEFIRMWSKANKFGNLFLGFNYSTGDPSNPIVYSDGTAYNKSTMYDFDDSRDKFGDAPCVYLKKGVVYKPRNAECDKPNQFICLWKSKHVSQFLAPYHCGVYLTVMKSTLLYLFI